MEYTQTIDVAAGIIWRGGHFLASQRPTNKAMEGYWQCVEHFYADRNLNVRLYFFHVINFSGDPCPVEGQNLRWITPDEATTLGFLPADAGVLDQLLAFGPALNPA